MGKRRASGPVFASRRVEGLLSYYYNSHLDTWIARSWPRKRKTLSPVTRAQNVAFAAVVKMIKFNDGLLVDAAYKAAKGTVYVPRDLLMASAFGKTMAAITADGTVFWSLIVQQQIAQDLLDAISQIPQDMLVRTPDGWRGLGVAPPNSFLKVSADGTVDWALLADADAQTLLDAISAAPGSMLFRGTDGWQALAPGDPGDILAVGDDSASVEWLPASSVGSNFFSTPFMSATDANNGGSGYLVCRQFFFPAGATIKTLAFQATANAAHNWGMALYSNGVTGNPHPDTLLGLTAEVASSVVGMNEAPLISDVVFAVDTLAWVCIWTNGATSYAMSQSDYQAYYALSAWPPGSYTGNEPALAASCPCLMAIGTL